MSNCIFNKENICINCGLKTKWPNVKVNCQPRLSKKEEFKLKQPSLIRKTINFAKGMVKSGIQGFKFCTEKQIKERHKICIGCDAFIKNKDKPNHGNCSDCGCHISLEPVFLNKLSHKSEKCPKDKWGPIEKKEGNNEEATVPSQENSQLQQGGCRPCQR